jgi:hypothetical protein
MSQRSRSPNPHGFDIMEDLPTTPKRTKVEKQAPGAPARIPYVFQHEPIFTRQIAPGRYYIGDLSYAIMPAIYSRIFEDEKHGTFTCGHMWAMQAPTTGKGEFQGSDFEDYSCDSLSFGIIPEVFVSRMNFSPLGHVHEFLEAVYVDFSEHGLFQFFTMTVKNGSITMDENILTICTNGRKNCWNCGAFQVAQLTQLTNGDLVCDVCLFEDDESSDSSDEYIFDMSEKE